MKLNFYRKLIIILFSISIFISCILYVPVYNSTKYCTLFSGDKIDYYRLLMELIVINVLFGTAFLFTEKLSDPDFQDKKTKIYIKRELKLFFSGIVVFFLFWGFLYLRISYLNNKSDSIYDKISLNTIKKDSLQKDYLLKKEIRKDFYKDFSKRYNIKWANNDIPTLWNGLEKGLLVYDTIPIEKDIVKNKYTLAGNTFKNTNEFIAFIKKNKFTDEELNDNKTGEKLESENKILYSDYWDYKVIPYRLDSNIIYYLELAAGCILILIYPLRLIIFFSKRFFKYLNS